MGVTGEALRWFKSYLLGRSQPVVINDATSESLGTKIGVPQVSVLGPLLFLIYTLPLADVVKKHVLSYHFYADDSQLHMSFKPGHLQANVNKMALENCTKDIKHWMIQNDLKLNTDKTAFLLFGTPQQLANTDISYFDAAGDIMERKLCARNLGVLLDSCLTKKDHISEVSKLAFYHLRNISHIRKYLTLSAAKTFVHALVCSRIDANGANKKVTKNTECGC